MAILPSSLSHCRVIECHHRAVCRPARKASIHPALFAPWYYQHTAYITAHAAAMGESRSDLLAWINELLQMNVTKIEWVPGPSRFEPSNTPTTTTSIDALVLPGLWARVQSTARSSTRYMVSRHSPPPSPCMHCCGRATLLLQVRVSSIPNRHWRWMQLQQVR
jgi:hypothetical protein